MQAKLTKHEKIEKNWETLCEVVDETEEARQKQEAFQNVKEKLGIKDLSLKELAKHDQRALNEGLKLQEDTVTSDMVSVLVPEVVAGEVERGEAKESVIANLFDEVSVSSDNVDVITPVVGSVRAQPVGEGQEYPRVAPDVNRVYRHSVTTKKIGVQVDFTREAIEDQTWDMLRIFTDEAGRAMARFKEWWAFREFQAFGKTVFNNDRTDVPEAQTTGRDRVGALNNTLSFEDILDLQKAAWMHDVQPDTMIAHPLWWWDLQKTSIYGGYRYNVQGNEKQPGDEGAKNSSPFDAGVFSEIPGNLNHLQAPEAPFNFRTHKTNVFVVDSDNVGMIAQKRALDTDEYNVPSRDVRAMKLSEIYGVGVTNEGRGVMVARNVVSAPSFPYQVQLTKSV